MTTQIKVRIANVYGVEKIYPACDQSRAFAEIAGTKTLTNQAIAQIKRLGFTVAVEATHPAVL